MRWQGSSRLVILHSFVCDQQATQQGMTPRQLHGHAPRRLQPTQRPYRLPPSVAQGTVVPLPLGNPQSPGSQRLDCPALQVHQGNKHAQQCALQTVEVGIPTLSQPGNEAALRCGEYDMSPGLLAHLQKAEHTWHSVTSKHQTQHSKSSLTFAKKWSRASRSSCLRHSMRTLASSIQMTGKGLVSDIACLCCC